MLCRSPRALLALSCSSDANFLMQSRMVRGTSHIPVHASCTSAAKHTTSQHQILFPSQSRRPRLFAPSGICLAPFRPSARRLIRFPSGFGSSDPYQALGLERSASMEDVKKQYRKLVRESHPDRFTDPKERKVATERAAKLNQAYTRIKNGDTGGPFATGAGRSRQGAQTDNFHAQVFTETLRLWHEDNKDKVFATLLIQTCNICALALSESWLFLKHTPLVWIISKLMPMFAALPGLMVKFSLFLLACSMTGGALCAVSLTAFIRLGFAKYPSSFRAQAVRNVEKRMADAL
eukprot:TRINITY_DN35410_c0_g1_i1.p1 TRINITY_DN35410_c0_g1~~TRINITY_DN35410_c0_g1_i1.p1  ORF type:complete len:292 (-),score=22.61 TRINITY_DN35410_c0_g1_i1:122-997(-)